MPVGVFIRGTNEAMNRLAQRGGGSIFIMYAGRYSDIIGHNPLERQSEGRAQGLGGKNVLHKIGIKKKKVVITTTNLLLTLNLIP